MRILIILLFFVSSLNLQAKTTVVETLEYEDIFKAIENTEKNVPSDEILVVFDVDDTLLVIDHCMIDDKLTKGIGKLFKCPSEPTEADLATRIKNIQIRGVNTIALTARGANLIKSTERELKRQGMNFFGEPYKGNKEIKKLKKKCRKKEEPPCYSRLKFKNGVMYSQGNNKGWVLKTLLEKLEDEYKYIIFVDDRIRNIDAVESVFKPIEHVEMSLFLYLRHRD